MRHCPALLPLLFLLPQIFWGQTPSTQLPTSNSQLQTPNSQLQTPNSKLQTPNFVNPFIGTGGHGHTYPGATAPFGMVQLSPDTRIDPMDWDGCSGYHYSDSTIYGFSHTHLSGTGVSDYCDILLMPFTGGVRLEPSEYAQPFQKKNERAEAGYYAVTLDRDRIRCELTASERVGLHRYTFPLNRTKGSILIDLRHRDEVLESHMEVVNDREIAGYRISRSWAKEQHVYFVARFSKPFGSSIVLDMSKNPFEALPSVTSKAIVGVINVGFDSGEPITVAVGISGTSIEGARRNLEAECAVIDFEKTKAATQAKWQQQLSKIEVEGGSDDQKTIFYTALYHCMVAPNLWSDVDGQYRGRDNKIHKVTPEASPGPSEGGEKASPPVPLPTGEGGLVSPPSEGSGEAVYTVFSLWDTHRALHPLLTLLEPERTSDFIRTFLLQYQQGGLLPVWELAANETDCMIGNHAIPVIADAYAKGVRGFDEKLALEAMLASANSDRYGLRWYREMGYVPADKEPESVSKTLEYAYDDWCIAQMALALGNDGLHDTFLLRGQSYFNLFDPATQFFRAKKNGLWHEPFDPYEVNFNYTEANAWQYRYSAPQDVWGLAQLFGGPKGLENQLDSLFSAKTKTTGRDQADITGQIGQYVHGNEPSHHIAYLYNYTNNPWKAQQRVRQIMDTQYANAPDGLSGNEDCGQMSAWLVWSAMGMYPATPGTDDYLLGTPWFEKMTLHLDGSRTLNIAAPGVSAQKYYVSKVEVDESDWFVPVKMGHKMLLKSEQIHFKMAEIPAIVVRYQDDKVDEQGGSALVPLPYVARGSRSFREKQPVALGCLDPKAAIFYTLDGMEPTERSTRYTKPFELKKTATLKFAAFRERGRSLTAIAQFYKIPDNLRPHRYNARYSPQYTAGGDAGLVDGIRGGSDFRTGDWQGFEGQNLDLVIDLGKSQKINRLSAGFFQDENAWIFFPSKVQFEISDDGERFSPLGEVLCDVAPEAKGSLQKDFSLKTDGAKGRYVRVVGVSLGQCPAGHKGAGYSCWVFADEVGVE
jgi:putative alpha-1,2-mannosidase